jgi:transcriptional regulator with XRE-family HTH domain
MDEQYRLELGRRIRKQRRAIGLTQVKLAAALGVTQVTISQWETGATVPSWTRHRQVARVLGIDVDLLFPPLPEGAAA